LDGNPIYGPKASDFDEDLTSADLDACHGRFKDGRYRYHVTADFPYIVGCFKAEAAEKEGASDGPGGGRPPPARRRRQTEDAVCTNTEYGAMLCDCTSGTLTQCDTLTDDDAHLCDDTSSIVTEVSDDENGSTSNFSSPITIIAIITNAIITII